MSRVLMHVCMLKHYLTDSSKENHQVVLVMYQNSKIHPDLFATYHIILGIMAGHGVPVVHALTHYLLPPYEQQSHNNPSKYITSGQQKQLAKAIELIGRRSNL